MPGVGRLVLIAIVAAASFSGFYQKWHFAEADVTGDDSVCAIERMLDGTAARPFVYRQLIPDIANAVDRVIPQTQKDALYDSVMQGGSVFDAILASPTARDRAYFFRYLVVYCATFAFAVLAGVGLYLVGTALVASRGHALLAAMTILLLVPCCMTGGGFNYDYAELAFIAFSVWVALRWNWLYLVPLVLLGELNKESFLIFVLTLYPLLRLRQTRGGTAIRVAGLAALGAAVYLAERHYFRGNEGATAEIGAMAQLRYLLHPGQFFFRFEATYGIPLPVVYGFFPLLLVFYFARKSWKHLPPHMQRHARIAAALNIPLYAVFSFPGEVRVLSMLYVPLMAVMLFASAEARACPARRVEP